MANFLSWSYSRLRNFLNCPKAAWCESIAPKWHEDRIPYVQSPAALAGDEIDKALTARVQVGEPLPDQYAKYESMCAVLANAQGAKFSQLDLALDQGFAQCGSKDWDRCWLRVKIDYANIRGSWAYFGDYKNGQIMVDEKQLALYAATGFMIYPELEQIDTAFIWLKHDTTSPKTYRRRELEDLWQLFIPDVERMNVAYATNHWPATPQNKIGGASVCKWCGVNRLKKCPVAAVPYGGR